VRLAARRAPPSLDRHERSLKLGPSFVLLGKVGGPGPRKNSSLGSLDTRIVMRIVARITLK
jgi:hypothetical protein